MLAVGGLLVGNGPELVGALLDAEGIVAISGGCEDYRGR